MARKARAIAALARQQPRGSGVQLRADFRLEASALAAILRDLSEAGLSRVELVVTRR